MKGFDYFYHTWDISWHTNEITLVNKAETGTPSVISLTGNIPCDLDVQIWYDNAF